MASYYRKQLEEFLKRLDVKAERVADVGGSQLPVKGRTKTWEVNHYDIFDLPEPHEDKPKPDFEIDLNKADSTGIYDDGEIYFDVFSSEKLNDKKTLPYDVVFCLEVMEYIYDPVSAVRNLHNLLKKGGTLYITFPFIYPHHEPLEHDTLRYTKNGAIKLLEMAGFEIELVKPRRGIHNTILQFFRLDGMRMSKNHHDHMETGYIIKAIKI